MEVISPSAWGMFYFPTDIKDNRIKFNKLEDIYTVGVPKDSYKKTYWGLKRTVFISKDLLELNSDNVNINIFQEFNNLKDK